MGKQGEHVKTKGCRRSLHQTGQGPLKQTTGTLDIAAMQVMVGHGHLDNALHQLLLTELLSSSGFDIHGHFAPEAFQGFVAFKILPAIKLINALFELLIWIEIWPLIWPVLIVRAQNLAITTTAVLAGRVASSERASVST